MLDLTSVMALMPYLLVAALRPAARAAWRNLRVRPHERGRDLIFAGIAAVYTLFMFVAAGLKFIVLSAVLFAPGTILYFWARREQGKPVFTPRRDWIIFVLRGRRRRRRHLRARDRLHHHLANGAVSWHRQRQILRRPLRGRPAAQGDGVRARPRASAADADATATSCCSTTCCGSTTPSATISTSCRRCATAASRSSRCTICSPRRSRSPRRRSGSSTTRWCPTRSGSAWSTRSGATSRA